MYSLDDFQYAMENTHVVLSPQKRLETFGTTHVNYHLITEDMDQVNVSRIREGKIIAQRPQILTPDKISRLMLEGFGEQAEQFASALSRLGSKLTILQYGFNISKAEIKTYETHEPMVAVQEKIQDLLTSKDDPMSALLIGVEDGWEVCLLKFMVEYIGNSGEGNLRDLIRRGLL